MDPIQSHFREEISNAGQSNFLPLIRAGVMDADRIKKNIFKQIAQSGLLKSEELDDLIFVKFFAKMVGENHVFRKRTDNRLPEKLDKYFRVIISLFRKVREEHRLQVINKFFSHFFVGINEGEGQSKEAIKEFKKDLVRFKKMAEKFLKREILTHEFQSAITEVLSAHENQMSLVESEFEYSKKMGSKKSAKLKERMIEADQLLRKLIGDSKFIINDYSGLGLFEGKSNKRGEVNSYKIIVLGLFFCGHTKSERAIRRLVSGK